MRHCRGWGARTPITPEHPLCVCDGELGERGLLKRQTVHRCAQAVLRQCVVVAVSMLLCFVVSVVFFLLQARSSGNLIATYRLSDWRTIIDIERFTWLGGNTDTAGYSGAYWQLGAAAHMPPFDESTWPLFRLARRLDGDVPEVEWYRYERRVTTRGVPFRAWFAMKPVSNAIVRGRTLRTGIDLSPLFRNTRIPIWPLRGPLAANTCVWYFVVSCGLVT